MSTVVDTNWTTCCRGSGNCPQVSLIRNGAVVNVLIKDDAGDSVRLTLDQYDLVHEQIEAALQCYNKSGQNAD